jgi:hypothetical protein
MDVNFCVTTVSQARICLQNAFFVPQSVWAVDRYQENFRMPPDTPVGAATIQVSAAWTPGMSVKAPVQ